MMLLIKKCGRCKQLLGIGCFYKRRSRKDGLQGMCKVCGKEAYSFYMGTPKGKVSRRATKKRYNQTPKGKKVRLSVDRRRRIKHPEKCKARTKVNDEIRAGRLKREPCEVCGETKVQAHHGDYSKHLDIQWLCQKHHSELHNQLKERKHENSV